MADKGKKTDKKPTTGQVVKEYSQAIILAVVLALIVRSFILQAFQIPSGSMIPTFLEGDRVLVSKFSYGVRNPLPDFFHRLLPGVFPENNAVLFETGLPQRWDVVVFIYPEDPDKDFVKRVVGLPGETVAMVNGQLYINGVKTDDPHARYDPRAYAGGRSFKPVRVRAGHYFMMGDNRDHSSDSRVWGTVDAALLRGKAWRLYWSWDSNDPDKSLTERFRGSRIGKKIE